MHCAGRAQDAWVCTINEEGKNCNGIVHRGRASASWSTPAAPREEGGITLGDQLNALTTIFTEFYYWVTIVFMFLIHVGFCTYEVGVSRRRNHLKTLMKNAMAIPLVTVTFFFFGWWIYFAFPNGPGITGGLIAAPFAEPWNPLMATASLRRQRQ